MNCNISYNIDNKCIFARPNIENVDDMVEMMNDESIQSMLSTKKRVITKESEMNSAKTSYDSAQSATYQTGGLKPVTIKFDADGNLNNWWTAEDYKKFEEKTNRL